MSGTKGLQYIWLALAGAMLAGTSALPQTATAQDVTYAGDVAAIVQENCVWCHRAGTTAPMVLDTYEQVRAFAPLIKASVETRTMPPGWYIDRTLGIQDFKNDPSLSEQDIGTIVSWVDSGTPLGDPSRLPQPVAFQADHEYWQLEQDQGWGHRT